MRLNACSFSLSFHRVMTKSKVPFTIPLVLPLRWRIQDFPDGGGGEILLFDKIFAENWMKMIEIGPGDPLGSANALPIYFFNYYFFRLYSWSHWATTTRFSLATTPKIKCAVIQLLIFGMNKQVIGIMKSNNMNFLSSDKTMASCRKLTRTLRKTGLFRNKKRIAVVFILLMMLYFYSYIPELVFSLTKLHNSLTAFSLADFSLRVRQVLISFNFCFKIPKYTHGKDPTLCQ